MKQSIRSFTGILKISILLRVIFGPIIFLSPFIATAVNLVLDGFDGEIFKRSGYARPQYSIYDKILDYYWYIWIILFIMVTDVPAKYLFLVLFLYRSIGQFLFVVFHKSIILFLFPNIFEKMFFYYLFSVLVHKEHLLMSMPFSGIALFIVTSISILIEYVIHIKKMNFSGAYLGKTSFWPKQTLNPYKAFLFFSLLFTLTILFNEITSTHKRDTYVNRAAKASKDGKILSYNESGSITGIVFGREYHAINVVLFVSSHLTSPLCQKQTIPVSFLRYPESPVSGTTLSFAYTDPCLSRLANGSYSLLLSPSDAKGVDILLDFTIQDGILQP